MRWISVQCLLIIFLITAGVLIGGTNVSYASHEGHGETSELRHVVSLEGKAGLSLFLAKLYNDNRLLYALAVTATMAFLGIMVAQVTEFILRFVGVK